MRGTPLKEHLHTPVHEADRLWIEFEQRRLNRRRARNLRKTLGALGAAVIASITFSLYRQHNANNNAATAAVETTQQANPRQSADSIHHAHERSAYSAGHHVLVDGSEVTLTEKTTLHLVRDIKTETYFKMSPGRGEFNMAPLTGRRFIIETPLATVEVLGTRFIIEHRLDSFHVNVTKGRVQISSPALDSTQLLNAGDSLHLPAPSKQTSAPTTDTRTPHRTPTPTSEQQAQAHKTADTIFAEADILRQKGEFNEAVTLLEQLVQSDRSAAALATFTRAKIFQDALLQPHKAEVELIRALKLNLPQSLQEDAWRRRILAVKAQQDPARAKRLFAQFRQRYPESAFLAGLEHELDINMQQTAKDP